MKVLIIFLGFCALCLMPVDGLAQCPIGDREVVSRAETAAAIGQAVGIDVYGESVVARQQPLKVVRNGQVWIVRGSIAPNIIGGVLRIEILACDGRISSISHGA
jgi:NTF2 fold immunity protein